jgi:octaprenyl-diphosphate synthase
MELGGLLGDWQEDEIIELKKYGHALGMAFQITDDIMDYRETAETTGKPVGNDLREGLLTYPLLSIVNDGNKDKLLEDIKGLNNGGNEQDIIDYVIAQGGIDNTLAVADKYCKDALAALAAVRDFPGKEFLVMAVENLADRKV